MKKIKMEFTPNQMLLITWALHSGLDQFQKHLMHQDWDDRMPKESIRYVLNNHSKLQKALNTWTNKIKKAHK